MVPKDAKRDCRRNYTLASAYIKATRRGKGDGRFRCARFCEKLERRLRFVSREPAIVVRVKVPIEHLGVEAAEQFDGEDLASLCEHAEARVVGRASHNRGKCGLPLRSHKRTTPGPKSQRDSHATRSPEWSGLSSACAANSSGMASLACLASCCWWPSFANSFSNPAMTCRPSAAAVGITWEAVAGHHRERQRVELGSHGKGWRQNSGRWRSVRVTRASSNVRLKSELVSSCLKRWRTRPGGMLRLAGWISVAAEAMGRSGAGAVSIERDAKDGREVYGCDDMASPGHQLMMVQVPAGMSGGQTLQVQTPAGLMSVQIPPGLTAGQSFQMKVPLPPQQTQPAIAQPVHAQPQRTSYQQPQPSIYQPSHQQPQYRQPTPPQYRPQQTVVHHHHQPPPPQVVHVGGARAERP